MVGNPGIRKSFRGQVHLLHALLRLEIDFRQQPLQLAEPLAACPGYLRPVQNHAKVVLQTPLHRVVEREIDRLRRDLSRRNAALITLRRRPRRLPERLRWQRLRIRASFAARLPTPAASSRQAQSFPEFFTEWFAGIYDRLRITAESFCRKVFCT